MSHNQPCSSCISASDGNQGASAAQRVLLSDTGSQEGKTTEAGCVNLGGGKWEHEEVVCERLVTRHASLPQSAAMAAPNYEEAAAIATEFVSSASRARNWLLSD